MNHRRMTDKSQSDIQEVEVTPEEAKRRDVLCKSLHEIVKKESVGTAINLLGNVMASIIVTNFPRESFDAGLIFGKSVLNTYANYYYGLKKPGTLPRT